MRSVLLACLFVVVGAAAWLLVSEVTRPATVDGADVTERQVPTLVARDSSGNGHDAIIQGPVQLGRPGHNGSSFSFDKGGSWLMVPPSADLNPGDRDFLVSAWIYLRTSPGPGETYDVVRKGISYTAPGEFKLEVLQHGRVRCTVKDDRSRTAVVTTSDTDLIDGRWHLIGCARTGGRWSVLTDETVTSTVADLGTVGNDVVLSIGSKYGLEDRPEGRLDEVKLVLGGPSHEDGDDDLARLEALQQAIPAAQWDLDEAPVSSG